MSQNGLQGINSGDRSKQDQTRSSVFYPKKSLTFPILLQKISNNFMWLIEFETLGKTKIRSFNKAMFRSSGELGVSQ
jgi:hypothetical protein